MRRRLKFLPHSLKTGYFACVAAPFLAIGLAALDWQGLADTAPFHAWLAVVTYVVLPWTLASLLIKRHMLFPHILIVFAALLCVIGFVADVTTPSGFLVAQAGLVTLCAFLALLMVNRDLLFPFLFENYRGFRRDPRIRVNSLVSLYVAKTDVVYELMLEDCSLTGVALYGQEEALQEMVHSAQRGDPMLLEYAVGEKRVQVPMAFMWSSGMAPVIKLGLQAVDRVAMKLLIDKLDLTQAHTGLALVARRAWGRTGMRRLLNYCFVLAFLAAMVLPSVSKHGLPTKAQFMAFVDEVSHLGRGSRRAPRTPPKPIEYDATDP